MQERLLLTVLGTNPQPARYSLGVGEWQAEARLAPIALFDLLSAEERPHRVLALCTPQAKRESLPLLEQALRGRCAVETVDVPGDGAPEDVNSYLKKVSDAVSAAGSVDLTVDVTHGWRHFSFLTYIAVLYLAALRGVRVRGAYYGLLNRNGPSPFLDLRPLLELPRWIHALEVLRETGSTAPLADALRDETQSQKIKGELSQLSDGYLSGLPLELGRAAHRIRKQSLKPLRKLLEHSHRLPLASELVERLDEILEPFSLIEPAPSNGWKRQILLSKQELERQAGIVDDLLRRGSKATALGLMNEWAVSWAAWRLGEAEGWLDYRKVRRRCANILRAITAVGKDPDLRDALTDEQRSLGEFWASLGTLRNAYHHHGMRPQNLAEKQIEQDIERIRRFWKQTLLSCPEFSLSIGGASGGRVLVSPIGMRPGALFSALQTCRADGGAPDVCLIICSRETEPFIEDAARRAGYAGAIERLLLEDPYGGRAEIECLAKTARRRLIGADEVLVNVTGGTTLMGLAAEAVADAARKLACPVRRFGLIDRRPPQRQDAEPYRMGEPFWLDAGEDSNADNY